MSDEIETPDAPETPPAGDVAPAPAAESTERVYTAAEYRAVQNEAKNLRARMRAAEEAAAAAAPALESVKSEAEALRAQVAAATEELRAHRLRQAVTDATRDTDDLRGLDPDLVLPHLSVEWADDGKPKGVTDALRKVAKRFPQLVAPRVPPQAPAGPGSGAAPTQAVAMEKRSLMGRPL